MATNQTKNEVNFIFVLKKVQVPKNLKTVLISFSSK